MTVVNRDFVVNNGLQITGYITSVGGSVPSNGQLLIGDATNGRFSVGSLTGSNGISYTQGAGTINITTNATSANTASTIVARDTNGAFTAGVITGVAAQKALTASNGSGTGQTSILLTRVGAGTDNKSWEFLSGSDATLTIRTVNDAYTASTNAIVIGRNTGYGLTTLQLMPGTGNVLLGTSTDDGVGKIQVNGDASVYGRLMSNRYGTQAAVNLQTAGGTQASPAAISASTAVGGIVSRGSDGSIMRDVGYIGMVTDGAVTSTSSPGYMTLGTTPSGAVTTSERMRIVSAGRILMNNTVDDGANQLQVMASASGYAITAVRNGTAAQYIGFGAAPNSSGSATDNYIDSYSGPANAKSLILDATTDSNNTTPTAGSTSIILRVLGSTKMVIAQSGNVLIGQTSDNATDKLQVNGTISAASPAAGSNNTQLATTSFVQNITGNYKSWTYLSGATTIAAANSGAIYYCGSTGGYTVTLPAPTTANYVFTLTNVTTDATNITIATASASIYNQAVGASTFTLINGATVELLSDGSNWTILSLYTKSPNFVGVPTAPTAAAGTNTTQLATTAFVNTIFAAPPAIGTTTRSSANFTTLAANAGATIAGGLTITGGATTDNFTVTGTSSVPTAAQYDNDNSIASTAFVQRALGNFSAITIIQSTTTLGQSAYGQAIQLDASSPVTVTLPAASTIPGGAIWFFAQGSAVHTIATPSGAWIFAPQAGMTGTSYTSLTVQPGQTIYMVNRGGAEWDVMGGTWLVANTPVLSPSLTGTPTTPTAALGTNTTQIASTAFVLNEFASPPPIGSTTPNTGAFTTLTAANGVNATGMDSQGAQFRAISGNYGTMLRNDGTNMYFLQTASGAQTGTWNTFRPLQWNLSTGTVIIDGTGLGTTLGGAVTATGLVTANAGVSTTTISTSGTITANSLATGSATISGGSINGTPIGATTASTGKFTTLTTTSTTTFGGRTFKSGSTYTAAGTTQATGTAITTDLCFVSAGAANAGVVLPPVAMGATCFVVNYSGYATVIYPPSGGYLDFGAVNVGITVANQTKLLFCSDGGSWFSMNATYA